MGTLPAMKALADGLTSSGFDAEQVSLAEQHVLVARQSEVIEGVMGGKVRFYTFVVVFLAQELESERAEELTDAARRYANKHKGGLPRGLQNGTLTIPVFLCERASDATRRWFREEQRRRWAAIRFPVLADSRTDELVYFTGRWSHGWVYRDYIMGFVTDIIAPALGRSVPAEEFGS